LLTLRAFIRIRRNEQILLLARCVFGAPHHLRKKWIGDVGKNVLQMNPPVIKLLSL
jgi:hypothetical protein